MPKRYSSKEIEAVLRREGFSFISQRGSHAKFRRDDRTVIVPAGRKAIPIGTFRSILRQSGLAAEDFE